jgi:hypothetical protein
MEDVQKFGLGPREVTAYWMNFYHREAVKIAALIEASKPYAQGDLTGIEERALLTKQLIVCAERAVDAASVLFPYVEARIAARNSSVPRNKPFVRRISSDMTLKEAQQAYAQTLERTDPIEWVVE